MIALKQNLVTADGVGVGYADSQADAAALSERLTALGEWMEGAPADADDPDSTYGRWKAWRKIARPGQLPTLSLWESWSITGPRHSGKTTAAAQYIASIIEEPDIHLYIVGGTMQIAAHCFGMVRDIANLGFAPALPGGGCARLFSLQGNTLQRVRPLARPIVWIDEMLDLSGGDDLRRFLSLAKSRPSPRIIWSG